MKITTYGDIDWLMLWQNERARKSWTSKGSKDWDKKASSFSSRTLNSPYVPLLLSRLPLQKEYTILDVGCGPGTLALPLAEQTAGVMAIDYSATMLHILEDQAKKRKLNNIETKLCSWEDDWADKDILPADIAIASRSMNVDDLPTAIDKLNAFAKKFVIITDRISPSPFDPDAFKAVGRDFKSGPDYIFTLNMLYAQNIHPCVEILELDRQTVYATLEEAIQSYIWMFKDLTDFELAQLEKYVQESAEVSKEGKVTITRRYPPRWAMIWWKKTGD